MQRKIDVKDTQRNKIIDIMKGICIIFIVAGHSGAPFTHFIYLFHVALFFMISGYLFKSTYSDSIESVRYFLKRKIKSLYLPYVICGVVFSLLHNIFIRINIYTDNLLLLEQVPQEFASITVHWTFKEIITNILKHLLLGGNREIGGAIWFIATLLEISILFCGIDFIGKCLSIKKMIIYQGGVSCIFLTLGYCFSIYNIRFNGIERLLTCYVLFYLGYLVNYLCLLKPIKDLKIHIIRFALGFGTLIILNKVGSIELSKNEYNNPLFLLGCSLMGGLFVYEIGEIAMRVQPIQRAICKLGKSTLSVVILHFLCFKIINFVGVVIEGMPLYLVASFPILFTGKFIWLAYTVVGLMVPVLCKELKDAICGRLSRLIKPQHI